MEAGAAGLFFAVALQAYVGALLLRKQPTLTLALLFFANGFVTIDLALRELGGGGIPAAAAVDYATSGLLILAAAQLAQLRAAARFASAVAATVLVACPILLAAGGIAFGPLFTFAGYAVAALLLALTLLRHPAHQGDTAWFLAALSPRFVELVLQFGPAIDVQTWYGSLSLAAVVALVLGLAAGSVLVGQQVASLQRVVLFLGLGAGLLSGAAQMTLPTARDLLFAAWSLGVYRPLVILLALMTTGFGGSFLSARSAARHGLTLGGAAVVFLSMRIGLTRVSSPSDILPPLLLAAASTLVLLPFIALLANTLASLLAARAYPVPNPTPTVGAPTLPQRQALRSLTRPERVLIALRGSSKTTIGLPAFTQRGVNLATDIPTKHLSAIVRKANEASHSGPLIGGTTGTRGIRHYWLTEAGRAVAEELAVRIGLPDPEHGRAWVGERAATSWEPVGSTVD